MAITAKNAKILWANAAGRCSFEGCGERLTANTDGQHYTLGQMAHIKGEKLRANRHDPDLLEPELSAYPNLVLMCAHHHTLIDVPENEEEFSVEVLLGMKESHEVFIVSRLEGEVYRDKHDLVRAIYPLMIENHAVFNQYGPHSDLARKNPMNEEAYLIWEEERLSTIVPNNRGILKVINDYIQFFAPDEIPIIERYRLHVRSYERWVESENSYEGVVRFPQEFSELVENLANACT